MSRTLYRNGRFLTAETAQPWAEAVVVDGALLSYVGDEESALQSAGPDAGVNDLGVCLVLPGFADAQSHLIWSGEALSRVHLTGARTLGETQERLKLARDKESGPVLWGRGWLFDSIPAGRPTAEMIDAVVKDILRPDTHQLVDRPTHRRPTPPRNRDPVPGNCSSRALAPVAPMISRRSSFCSVPAVPRRVGSR